MQSWIADLGSNSWSGSRLLQVLQETLISSVVLGIWRRESIHQSGTVATTHRTAAMAAVGSLQPGPPIHRNTACLGLLRSHEMAEALFHWSI